MKKLLTAILTTVTSITLASTTVYNSFQSSYISNSGTVTDKEPVVQFGFDTYETITEDLSFHVGAFANYSPNSIDGWYSEHSLINESDGFIGLAYSSGNNWVGLDYEYWYYPHINGEDEENVIHLFYQYYGTFTYTLSSYYYINDGYDYLFDVNPRIGYKYKIGDKLSLGAEVGTYYRLKDSDRVNGFNSCNFKLTASYKDITLFYKKWYQIDSRLDSDYNDSLANDCCGITWSLSF